MNARRLQQLQEALTRAEVEGDWDLAVYLRREIDIARVNLMREVAAMLDSHGCLPGYVRPRADAAARRLAHKPTPLPPDWTENVYLGMEWEPQLT